MATIVESLADETPSRIESHSVSKNLNLSERIDQKKLARSVGIYLLSLAVSLGVLSTASQAMAALQSGDRGPQVAALQRRLKQLGLFPGQISSYFDSATKDAVIRFQQNRGLIPDGMVGQNTLSALQINTNRPSAPASTARRPSTSQNSSSRPSVLALQKRLQAGGFYRGALDGILGQQTRDAITAAQQAYGISS